MSLQKASSVIKDLSLLTNPEKARGSERFFKTAKGQYGYGDVFIGITVPESRVIATKYRDLSFEEVQKLLSSKIHEYRLVALHILVSQFERALDDATRLRITKFYQSNFKHVNNWDLVDTSARMLLGTYLIDKDRKMLYKLATSHNMWERRISVIATYAFIRVDDFTDTLKLSKMLFKDPEDLMHKAVGWMLREVGKRSSITLKKFLNEHAHEMPRTSLRYAIERFPEIERKKYLLVKMSK